MFAKLIETQSIPSLPFLADGQNAFLATARLQAQAYGAVMRYQIETFNFLRHRFEQDLKLANDLAASGEFNDAFDVTADFMQRATTEYSAEAGKMATLGSRLGSETARQLRKQAEELAGDLAVRTVA